MVYEIGSLKEIDFYGVKVNISADTDSYLAYRYGENWKIPDRHFNQAGKWRGVKARVLLKMSYLAIPSIDIDSETNVESSRKITKF